MRLNFTIDISSEEIITIVDKIDNRHRERYSSPPPAPSQPHSIIGKKAQLKNNITDKEIEEQSHSDLTLRRHMRYDIMDVNERHIKIANYLFPTAMFDIYDK